MLLSLARAPADFLDAESIARSSKFGLVQARGLEHFLSVEVLLRGRPIWQAQFVDGLAHPLAFLFGRLVLLLLLLLLLLFLPPLLLVPLAPLLRVSLKDRININIGLVGLGAAPVLRAGPICIAARE